MRPAEQLVGIVCAASQAIESWFAVGDPTKALEAATGARHCAVDDVETDLEAERLSMAVPEPVLHVVSERVAHHWRAYEEALDTELTREQTQAIHFALLACVNKELESLRQLEPELSPGVMARWWVEYS